MTGPAMDASASGQPFGMSAASIAQALIGRASLFSVSGIAGRLLQLLATPLYLHFLTSREFAIQAVALLNEQILLILVSYAFTNALGKYYWEASREGRTGEVVGTALVAIAISTTAFGVAWQLLAPAVARITLDGSATSTAVLRLVGVSFIGNVLLSFSMSIWLVAQRPVLYALGNIALYAGAAAASVTLLLLAADPSPIHVILGWTVGATTLGTFGLVWVCRKHTLKFSKTVLRQLAIYGLPLVPAAFLMLALNSGDRYILRQLEGLSAVGVLSVAVLIATGASHATVNAFKLSWATLVWRIRGQPGEAAIHRDVLTWYVCGQVFVIAALAVTARPLTHIIANGREEYVDASMLIPLIYAGYALFGLYDIFSAGYFFVSRTYYYSVSVAFATAANIAANLLLIPRVGVWGAGWANIAGYGVLAFMSYIFGRKYFDVAHDWRRAACALFIGAAVTSIGLLAIRRLAIGYVVAAAALAAFPLALIATGFTTEREKAYVRRAVSQLRLPRG